MIRVACNNIFRITTMCQNPALRHKPRQNMVNDQVGTTKLARAATRPGSRAPTIGLWYCYRDQDCLCCRLCELIHTTGLDDGSILYEPAQTLTHARYAAQANTLKIAGRFAVDLGLNEPAPA